MFTNNLLANLSGRVAPATFQTRLGAIQPLNIIPIIGGSRLTTGLIDEARRKKLAQEKELNFTVGQIDPEAIRKQATRNYARAGGYNVPAGAVEAQTEEARAKAFREANLPAAPIDYDGLMAARINLIRRAQDKAFKRAEERAQNGGNLFTRNFNY